MFKICDDLFRTILYQIKFFAGVTEEICGGINEVQTEPVETNVFYCLSVIPNTNQPLFSQLKVQLTVERC